MSESETVVVTGSSRDVGKFATLALGQAGYNILGLYKNPQHERDQAAIVKEVKGYKVNMEAVNADLLDPETPGLIIASLKENFGGKAHALLLNASGGYGKSLEEAREINVFSQLRLVDALLDYLADGSAIVFNTSDPSHRFHTLDEARVGGSGEYNKVAKTKNEMEAILRKRIPEFALRGIRVAIVDGNGLDGSFVSRVLKKKEGGLVEEWQVLSEDGNFPTMMEMAVADLKVIRGNYLSGHTEYVGIAPEYHLYPSMPASASLRLSSSSYLLPNS